MEFFVVIYTHPAVNIASVQFLSVLHCLVLPNLLLNFWIDGVGVSDYLILDCAIKAGRGGRWAALFSLQILLSFFISQRLLLHSFENQIFQKTLIRLGSQNVRYWLRRLLLKVWWSYMGVKVFHFLDKFSGERGWILLLDCDGQEIQEYILAIFKYLHCIFLRSTAW